MKTNKNSLVKSAFSEAKKRFVIVTLPLSFFALINIGILVLGFFFPFTLVLTVPFLVIPSFFSLAAINSLANNQNTHEGVGFFIMFRAYFSPLFRGSYRVIIGFLKSLLSFIVTSLILSLVLINTVVAKDPAYIAFMERAKTITDNNVLIEELNNFINTNQTFNNVMFIEFIASFFVGFIMFIHHFSINHFKNNYNYDAKLPLPYQDLNVINSMVIKSNRGTFYKNYFKLNWFLIILIIAGYAIGTLIPFFFLPEINMIQASVVGMFGSFILVLLFIPYYLNGSMLMFKKYRPMFVNTLIDLSKKSLEELKKANSITETKEKEVLEILESQKEEKKEKDTKDK